MAEIRCGPKLTKRVFTFLLTFCHTIHDCPTENSKCIDSNGLPPRKGSKYARPKKEYLKSFRFNDHTPYKKRIFIQFPNEPGPQ